MSGLTLTSHSWLVCNCGAQYPGHPTCCEGYEDTVELVIDAQADGWTQQGCPACTAKHGQGENTYHYESFGETLAFAGAEGWDEDGTEDAMLLEAGITSHNDIPDEIRCSVSDALEESAIEYLREHGWTVTGYDDGDE